MHRWLKEAKAQNEHFNDKNLTYMLDELRHQAEERKNNPIQPAPIDGVWQADGLISAELKAKLIAGVAKLENVPEDKIDYHPGSNKQVIDLVHPSLYCLRLGRSRQTDVPFSVEDTLRMFGGGKPKGKVGRPLAGTVEAKLPAASIEENEDDGDSSDSSDDEEKPSILPAAAAAEKKLSVQRWNNKNDYSESAHWAWLPAEFEVSDDRTVSIRSYINNLHPVEHAELYPVLASIAEQFLPMWERVLTFLKAPPTLRIPCPADWSGISYHILSLVHQYQTEANMFTALCPRLGLCECAGMSLLPKLRKS
jgi:hypothetical protein